MAAGLRFLGNLRSQLPSQIDHTVIQVYHRAAISRSIFTTDVINTISSDFYLSVRICKDGPLFDLDSDDTLARPVTLQ